LATKDSKKKEKTPQDEKEMLIRIAGIFSGNETNDYERRKVYEAVAKIISERDNPQSDCE